MKATVNVEELKRLGIYEEVMEKIHTLEKQKLVVVIGRNYDGDPIYTTTPAGRIRLVELRTHGR